MWRNTQLSAGDDMTNVFHVQHKIQYGNRSHRKAIGVYTSLTAAAAAIERVRDKPGFSDPRGAFTVYKCEIDRSYWPAGLDAPANRVASSLGQAGPDRNAPLKLFSAYYDNADADDESVTIGYYSTLGEAAAIARQLSATTGVKPPFHFDVGIAPVDQDGWVDGFVLGE